jgi:hypothetical protein
MPHRHPLFRMGLLTAAFAFVICVVGCAHEEEKPAPGYNPGQVNKIKKSGSD